MIEGAYKVKPTGSYWKDVVVTIPNGAINVQITHNSVNTYAGTYVCLSINDFTFVPHDQTLITQFQWLVIVQAPPMVIHFQVM